MGRTAKAKLRIAIVLALAAMMTLSLLPSLSITSVPHRFSDAQLVPTAPPSLSIGYSPSTLSPAQDGIPVFSSSDTMWVESSFNQSMSLNLLAPNGRSVSVIQLSPSSAARLYSFSGSDPEGTWTLLVSTPSGDNSLPIVVVNPGIHDLGMGLEYYSLQNDQLNLGFTVPPTQDYNIEGCIAPKSLQSTVDVPIPSAVGTGLVETTWNGTGDVSMAIQGKMTQPFTYWFEIYYSYSYSNFNGDQFVSRQVMVGKSEPQLFTTAESLTTLIDDQAPFRSGRYILRSYFESGQGLSVSETPVLVVSPSEGWIWLGSCSTFQISGSSKFQQSFSLAGSPTLWPTLLYYMYDYKGVDAEGILPFNIQLARIDFRGGMQGNSSLTGVTFSLSKNPSIDASSSSGDSVYVASSQFPIEVSVTPKFGSSQLAPVNVALLAPDAVYNAIIPSGKVQVQIEENGAALKGAVVQLSNNANGSTSETSGPKGNVTFYVPAGSYEIRASYGSSAQRVPAIVTVGNETNVVIDFSIVSAPQYLQLILGTAVVLGLLINAYVWFILPRMRRLY